MSRGRGIAPRLATYPVDRLSSRRDSPLGGYEYLVVWLNYPEDEATWEPRAHIPEHICASYDAALAAQPQGEGAAAASSVAPSSGHLRAMRQTHIERELSELEKALLLDSKCPVPKQWQSNTPNGGFTVRTWGFLVFNFSCVQIADFDEIFGNVT